MKHNQIAILTEQSSQEDDIPMNDRQTVTNMPCTSNDDVVHDPYLLYEMDWVCIGAYMDSRHIPPLYTLCSSSLVDPSCLGHDVSWALLLHHLDIDVRRMVIDLVHEGTCIDIYTI